MKIRQILGNKGVYVMDDGSEVPFRELKQTIKDSKNIPIIVPKSVIVPEFIEIKKRGRKRKKV